MDNSHDHDLPRPLPDASKLPHGLIKLVVWTEDFSNGRELRSRNWKGKVYTPSGDVWAHNRSSHTLQSGEIVDWSYDGIDINYFNRLWLIQPENDPGGLIRLGLWAFDRYAVDMGLKSELEKPNRELSFEHIEGDN